MAPMASRAWQPNGRRRKAIVVGASWAGLQTASALKKAGLEVAILTENEDVGGESASRLQTAQQALCCHGANVSRDFQVSGSRITKAMACR